MIERASGGCLGGVWESSSPVVEMGFAFLVINGGWWENIAFAVFEDA